jgi:hypothetical protein
MWQTSMQTLKDLHWFTFEQETKPPAKMTIWRAIAYIMSLEKECKPALEEYQQLLQELEYDSAVDFIEYNRERDVTTHVPIEGDLFGLDDIPEQKDIDYRLYKSEPSDMSYVITHLFDDICLNTNDRQQLLKSLNMDRLDLVDSLRVPSILYRVLENEFFRITRNTASALKMANEQATEPAHALFQTSSLKNWKVVSDLSRIGLLSSNKTHQRMRNRKERCHSELLVIGMLINELWKRDPESVMRVNKNRSTDIAASRIRGDILDSIAPEPDGGSSFIEKKDYR